MEGKALLNLNELNTTQRTMVEAGDGPQLILAGAGSGKTRVLTYRIAYLVLTRGIPPHRILALTFTNKAAKVMTSRVENLLNTDTTGIWVGTFHANCARILRREGK